MVRTCVVGAIRRVWLTRVVTFLAGALQITTSRSSNRRALRILLVRHLTQPPLISTFHASVYSLRVLHALSNLSLDQVFVDLIYINLRQLSQMLYRPIRKLFLTRFYHYEHMLEKLSHHLLHRVDNSDMEAVQSEFKHRAIIHKNKGG